MIKGRAACCRGALPRLRGSFAKTRALSLSSTAIYLSAPAAGDTRGTFLEE
jgi:hypothetical protein